MRGFIKLIPETGDRIWNANIVKKDEWRALKNKNLLFMISSTLTLINNYQRKYRGKSLISTIMINNQNNEYEINIKSIV